MKWWIVATEIANLVHELLNLCHSSKFLDDYKHFPQSIYNFQRDQENESFVRIILFNNSLACWLK